ncbi:MAG: SusC/RagA family TonB-linked outer membrane protein [Chitinophagaceae bacterium]|nr:SusC/RagA family TonB-linked outer membrane protein [Chitinophagaceae bacterium]
MKLTAFFLLGLSLQVSAVAVSQKITFHGNGVALEEVFKSIEHQTGYGIFYNAKLVRASNPVSIEADQMELEEFLNELLKDQPLIYSLKQNTIIVGRKPIPLIETTGPKPVLDIPPITVTGIVTGLKGQPLGGATIQVRNKSITVSTDEKGYFEVEVDPGSTLIISYIGFETMEIKVNSAKTLNIEMRVTDKRLDTAEVVINTGFQKMKPNEVTGSVTYISEEKLDQRIAPDVLSRLNGITNGLVFNKTPAGETEIRIRGESTLYGKTSPLIVVDNFPFDGNLSAIDPNNVESISVLKDAAAASIWGVQAGNGVIVITTRKGRMNQPVKVELNANVIIGERPDLHYGNKITSEQYIDLETKLFAGGYYDYFLFDPNLPALSPVAEILNKEKNGEITSQEASQQIAKLKQNDVKSQKEKYLYQPSVYQQYQMNVSSGGAKSSYFFSAGFDNEKTNIKGNAFRRINLASNYSFRPVKNLELSNSIYYHNTHSVSTNGASGFFGEYPYTEYIDANGHEVAMPVKRKDFEDTISNHGFLDWHYYPLTDLKYAEATIKNNDIRILAGINYEMFKGISIDAKYQYQYTNNNSTLYTAPESYEMRNLYNKFAIVTDGEFTGSNYNGGLLNRGTYSRSEASVTGQNGRLALQVNKKFDIHSIIGIAGFEFREVKTATSSSRLLGYDKNNGSFVSPDLYEFYPTYPSGMFEQLEAPGTGFAVGGTLSRFRSYFANLSYTLMDKYSLSASARADGANYFGVKTNLKTVPLWSAGVKWDISKEKFFNSGLIDNLSVGATTGYNGNLDQSLASVITIQYSSSPDYVTGLPNASVTNYPNPDLRWEKTLQTNLRTDFALAKNALYGSIEFYWKKGVDLIGFTLLDPTTGIRTMKGNFAEMKTKGADIQISSDILRRRFKWNATLIYNYTSEKITKYDPGTTFPEQYLSSFEQIVPIVGKPLKSVFAYRWAGLNPGNGNPGIYLGDTINYNPGDAVKIEDLRYIGRYNPPIFGSLKNTFAWNNLSLAINITYKFNHYFRRNSVNYGSLISNGWMANGSADYALRWQKPGDETRTNVPAFNYPLTNLEPRYTQADVLIEKADHIRLQFVSVGYQFDGRKLQKAGIERLRFTFTADNVGILWRANDHKLDPDQPYASFLTPRTYAFGITANF